MVAYDSMFAWIESLAKDERQKALKAKRQHKRHFVNGIYLNAILTHTLTVAKRQGILNAWHLPALNLLPDEIPGKIK